MFDERFVLRLGKGLRVVQHMCVTWIVKGHALGLDEVLQ
jgi:hypothetical protein